MRKIEELIETVDKYSSALIQKPFESKKNTVGYVLFNSQPRVLKWYVPGLKKNMDTEYEILKKGSTDLAIPTALEKDEENNVLIMSYLIGQNVCDLINDEKLNFKEKKRITIQLADWLAQFHTIFKSEDGFRIRGDATLRNFIISKDQLWGVDFEESRPGKPAEDLATLCASLLSTDPMFTDDKFQLCQILLEGYQQAVKWKIDHINEEVSYALLERIQWRPTDEDILRKYATRIRTKGMRVARHNF